MKLLSDVITCIQRASKSGAKKVIVNVEDLVMLEKYIQDLEQKVNASRVQYLDEYA